MPNLVGHVQHTRPSYLRPPPTINLFRPPFCILKWLCLTLDSTGPLKSTHESGRRLRGTGGEGIVGPLTARERNALLPRRSTASQMHGRRPAGGASYDIFTDEFRDEISNGFDGQAAWARLLNRALEDGTLLHVLIRSVVHGSFVGGRLANGASRGIPP